MFWNFLHRTLPLLLMSGLLAFTEARAAQTNAFVSSQKFPLRFFADENYPPMTYLENGVAKGMDVEFTHALAKRMNCDIQIELTNWYVAQEVVLRGEGDGLISMSISEERRQEFDFSTPVFTREFGLLVRKGNVTIHAANDLGGKKVGVTAGGFPKRFLESRTNIQLVVIQNYQDGFARLSSGALDAIGADLWVAAYILEKSDVPDLMIVRKPFATADAAIAVKKGNVSLLAEVNRAVKSLIDDGTVSRIREEWRPQEIVLLSRERIHNLIRTGIIIALTVVFLVMGFSVYTLRRQVRIRRQVEAALRENREHFRNLAEASFEGIGISEDGRLINVNDQLLKMLGYERDELVGKKVIELVVPESRVLVAEAIRSGQEYDYQHRLLRKDGSSFFAEARAKTVTVGNRTLRLAALRDITERKRAEQLREAQRQVLEMIATGKSVPETMTALVQMIEAQSQDMICSILLLDSDGTHIRHCAAPSLPAEYIKAIDGLTIGPCTGSCGTAAFRRKSVFVADIASDPLWADYKHLALPNGLRACWSTPIFDAQQNVLGTFAIYHRNQGLPSQRHLQLIEMATHTAAVCLAKHRTDEALRESEEKFKTLFECANDAIFIMDDHVFLDCNRMTEKMFGLNRDQIIGHSPVELSPQFQPDGRASAQKAAEKISAAFGGHPQFFEWKHHRNHGTIFDAEVSLNRFELGGEYFLQAIVRDVTERKRVEDSLRRAQKNELRVREEFARRLLAAQEAERSRIAAELHDSLGQNLSVIKNRAHLSRQLPVVQPELANHLEAIERVVTDAITETRSLAHNLRPPHIDQIGLTDSLLGLIRDVSQASQIHFERRIENVDDIFQAEAATNIFRIVQEALNNLIKHSQAHEAIITLERDVRSARLRVADDGVGFDVKEARRGLGLTSMTERVRILGGELEIHSEPGKGTQLTVKLPFTDSYGAEG